MLQTNTYIHIKLKIFIDLKILKIFEVDANFSLNNS